MNDPFARIGIPLPISPMLCKAVPAIPEGTSPGAMFYEPKWDGFRCLVVRDGDDVELASRGTKPLTRYFPEVVESVRALLPEVCVLDAEVVVRAGEPGASHLDWDALSQRIHPAASRIAKLSAETPAELVLFDLLALDGVDWTPRAFRDRRAALLAATRHLRRDDPIHVTRTTTDPALAHRWFEQFEGAGLDGVVAKPADDPYAQGKRAQFKIKHVRTADVVAWGYRTHTSGEGVGSLLLGAYTPDGTLHPVGGASAFSMAYRRELVDLLDPMVRRDEHGEPVRAEGARSRFTSRDKDTSVTLLEPELVCEVKFDQLEGDRFRHSAQFLRWRPDRDPASCLLAQIDRPLAYDLDAVLGT